MPKLSAKLMVSHGPRSHGRGLLVRSILSLAFLNNYKQSAGLEDGAAVFRFLWLPTVQFTSLVVCMHECD